MKAFEFLFAGGVPGGVAVSNRSPASAARGKEIFLLLNGVGGQPSL